MTRDGRNRDSSTDFGSFDGELELDMPDTLVANNQSPCASCGDAEPVAAPASLAPHSHRGQRPHSGVDTTTSRGAARRLRPSRPIRPSRWGPLFGPLFLLGLLSIGGLLAYKIHSSYMVGEKRYRFGQLAQGLQQALLPYGRSLNSEHIKAAVARFAQQSDVTVQHVNVTIEPLNADTLPKLPAPARTAIGIVSRIPNHRLPYWVVGFDATLKAKHGWSTDTFQAQRYTWIDRGGMRSSNTNPAASIGATFEKQMKKRLKRILGDEME